MKRRMISGLALAGVGVGGYLLARRGRKRGNPLPLHHRLNLPSAAAESHHGTDSILFIGTATTLIRCNGFTILTDPNFLHRGEEIHMGYGLMRAARLTDPAIEFADLPDIDFVVLSHIHEDHFDRLVAEKLDRDIPILTTADAAFRLRRIGFRRTLALTTWDSVEVTKGPHRVRLTAMPGSHGPLVVASLLPSVMGSMLDFTGPADRGRFRVYVSGDTIVHEDLRDIPRRFPGVDLALLHLGGTRILGILVTMDAAQGIEAIRIIGPRLAIPIHFNDYPVFKSPLDDFVRAVQTAGLQDRVHYLQHGEEFDLGTFMRRAPMQAAG